MAHFAEIDENNLVAQVIVVPDSEEHRGAEFINNDLGISGNWIQTSITGRIRKVFAQPGYSYLPDLDCFKPNKPEIYPSFIFDENLWAWLPPVEMPTDKPGYFWDEDSISWVMPSPKIPASWIDGKPPVALPMDGKSYTWDEENLSWAEVPLPDGWTYGEDNVPTPPFLPEDNGNIHYWNSITNSWVDSGKPLPVPSDEPPKLPHLQK